MSNKYDDIINLPRPESKYPRMPRANRAAQFSPFCCPDRARGSHSRDS